MNKPYPWGRCFQALATLSLGLQLQAQTGATTSATAQPPEADVKPGVNAEFLKPHVDVAQWTERFEHEGREIYDQRERIVAAAKVKPGEQIADIGAGTGLFTMLFAERVGPTGKVFAVDIVKDFLSHIAERATAAGLKNIQPVRGTERSTELAPSSISLAFICDTYHHFEYPQHTLASIHQALKPGGELVLVDFKRIPGKTSEWTLNHVRAGQEVFSAEIEAAGFKQIEQLDFLKDNYIVRFRKTGP